MKRRYLKNYCNFSDVFIYLFLERGEGGEEERERNIIGREKQWCEKEHCMLPNQGLNPQQALAQALSGIWTGDLSLWGRMPHQRSHMGQGADLLCFPLQEKVDVTIACLWFSEWFGIGYIHSFIHSLIHSCYRPCTRCGNRKVNIRWGL